MNFYNKIIYLFACLAILGGCSHDIQLTPPLDNLRGMEVSRKIDKNVGYFISAEDLAKKVTSPGGGGDRVTYQPYRDTEGALNTILSKVFNKVYSIDSVDDIQFLSDKNIKYIFKPAIQTDSSSNSAFTWPPTTFIFELTCSAVDTNGASVWEKTVSATGKAEYDEFKSDFSLSARRASDQAFQKMLNELSNADEL